MGKSRDWMYSTVETSGQATSGFNQYSTGQSAISKFKSRYKIDEYIYSCFSFKLCMIYLHTVQLIHMLVMVIQQYYSPIIIFYFTGVV